MLSPLACADAPTSLVRPATYNLVTLNGVALPTKVHASVSDAEILTEALTLNADGSFIDAWTMRRSSIPPGSVVVESFTSTGRYTVRHDTLWLTYADGSLGTTGELELIDGGRRLSGGLTKLGVGEYVLYEFQRQ
jgi:hypothetical protein